MSKRVRQFTVEDIEVQVYPTHIASGAAAADHVAETLRRAIAERGRAIIILATGASQYEFLDALRKAESVAWENVTAFHLDEYLGITADHPASFRRYLRERVFDHLPLAAFHFLEGDAPDPHQEAQRYSALLAAHTIDIACIGIGENGHLAFNDPPADFTTSQKVLVVTLDHACRMQQVGEGHFPGIDDVPTQALTLSIPAILEARAISCVVPDLRKAGAVQKALEDPISPDCPASSLRMHSRCRLFLDGESASRLSAIPPFK